MDFAESWCSLLELFVSSAGLKLRMQLVDTVLFKSGRALGHFYTNRDGAVCRFSAHEITRSSIYQRLASLHNLDPSLNPYGYIAVAHYSTGVSRLLKRAELQAVMSVLSGPYEFGEAPPHLAAQHEGLFCLQSYLVPGRDLRYIAAYDLSEGPLCTVLGRRHSARYTHALDDPAPSLPLEALSDPDEPGFNGRPLSSQALARPTSAIDGRPLSGGGGGGGGGADGYGYGYGGGDSQGGAAVPRASLTAEELLVESQLVAMGLLEPRRAAREGRGVGAGGYGGIAEGDEEGGGEEGGEGGGDGEEEGEGEEEAGGSAPDGVRSSLPAPKRVKDDVAKVLQTISSFVERAHGQRIVGLVAEFVVAAGPGAPAGMGGALALTAVHAVQLDPRASRGRLGTFTERWGDYLEGLAPAPAPQAPARRNQAPSVLRGGDSSLVMTDRATGLLLRTSPAAGGGGGLGSAAAAAASSMSVSPYNGASLGVGGALSPYDRLSINAPPSPSGSLFSPGGAARGGGGAAVLAASPRLPGAPPSSPGGALTRIYSASPSAAHHRAVAAAGDYTGRPGSAPAAVVKVGRHVANSAHSSAANGHYTLRNAMSAARPGGGGNPTGTPGGPESYNLWLNREGAPTDSMSARLALEVEALRERLQRQTDIAVRAEVALQQLAVSSAREAGELRNQVEELRIEVGRLGEAKRNLGSEYERLRTERLGLQAGRSELGGEVDRLREQLAAERETLSRAVRDAGGREEGLEAQLRAAREEREEALGQLGGLRRRLEEEGEVVEALRGQLYDYKQLTAQLQAQVRRGRNNKQMLQSLGGLPSTMPSVVNMGATLPPGGAGALAGMGGGGGGGGGVRASTTKEADDSDAETDLAGPATAGAGGGGGDHTPTSGGGAGHHKATVSGSGVSARLGGGYGARRS
ncbi:hypothetical protein CHLRE_05g245701v5 [Chlamydomonas reinhardtii]|uniref:Uncharacterized protein n=1 Tax=Chlamydomonas reinhardtii TaxID=3055 RepID=A0A2K3DS73_CHLRE|nr:uncharacterized protein CHLRE_05g245701v5 [Chlamydomonas reinhardtii]PNW83379.1 hypothetical protein CHLRE_05g245701v5 [Chlamydomonas reinhardtii]